MLDKEKVSMLKIIHDTIKLEAVERLEKCELFLNAYYNLNRELKFPFGPNHGWDKNMSML